MCSFAVYFMKFINGNLEKRKGCGGDVLGRGEAEGESWRRSNWTLLQGLSSLDVVQYNEL